MAKKKNPGDYRHIHQRESKRLNVCVGGKQNEGVTAIEADSQISNLGNQKYRTLLADTAEREIPSVFSEEVEVHSFWTYYI